jgi:hypothetical protein
MSVAGKEDRWPVYLPEGISTTTPTTPIGPPEW